MTLDSLPDLDTSGLCLVKNLPTALTCWPYRNMALRDGARNIHTHFVGRQREDVVGRDAELDQLRGALERAGAGHGQVVAVVGEPGVGKSRLFHEFTHSHRVHGWLVLESSSVSYGKATSSLPVIDLLRRYFHIEARDDARRVREKVTGKLLALDRELELLLPAFLSLLDVLPADDGWYLLDPSQ